MIDTRITPLPVETVTPIRPSEAIRLGCLIAPVQSFGAPMIQDKGSACVLGALALGFGWGEEGGWASDYSYAESLPVLSCPVGECGWRKQTPAYMTLYHLNDVHRWTRERIASWMEASGL